MTVHGSSTYLRSFSESACVNMVVLPIEIELSLPRALLASSLLL